MAAAHNKSPSGWPKRNAYSDAGEKAWGGSGCTVYTFIGSYDADSRYAQIWCELTANWTVCLVFGRAAAYRSDWKDRDSLDQCDLPYDS